MLGQVAHALHLQDSIRLALETVMSVHSRMINDLGVSLITLVASTCVRIKNRPTKFRELTGQDLLASLRCVRIKNRPNRIQDFTGQDLLASFKKLELKQLLS